MRDLLAAVAILAGLTHTVRADWPRFRGPDATGISPEKNWLGTWTDGAPKRLWKSEVGRGFSSIVVSDGKVFAQGHDDARGEDMVVCVASDDGKLHWKHTYAEKLDPKYYEGGTSATPTVDRDQVFTISKGGEVFCLKATDGSVVWHRNLEKDLKLKHPEWGYAGSPHLEGELVIYNAGSHGIALKKSDGTTAWVSGTEASGYSTPVPFTQQGRRLLAIFAAKHLVAVDPKDGQAVWKHPWETSYDVNASDPVFQGNSVFISSGYGKGGSVLDLSSGQPKEVWFNKEIRSQMAGTVIIGDHIYGQDGQGGDKSGTLKCLDLKTGKVKWTSPPAETGALAAVDGRIVWLTGRGEVIIVEAKPGAYQEIARAQVAGGKFWSLPVVSNGRLYVRNWKGELVCLDLRGKDPLL